MPDDMVHARGRGSRSPAFKAMSAAFWFCLLIYAMNTNGCLAKPALADAPLSVFVSIAPQQYFVQQIGGDRVDVRVMIPPGASPHTYEPRPQQMAALARARLYLAIGVPFEAVWLDRLAAANPNLQVVHIDRGIPKIAMADEVHFDGENQAEQLAPQSTAHGEHGGLDPHIWLSPPLVRILARSILAALQQADPAGREAYAHNYQKFSATIDGVDAELRRTFAGRQGQAFMVFHPAWGYLAQAYGLRQVPIEVEGKAPKAAQLQALITMARQQGIKVVFVQPQVSDRSARLIAREIGGEVVVADPLALDWTGNLRAVARQFAAALK
jgi:zinc transport system substrate-binding protein